MNRIRSLIIIMMLMFSTSCAGVYAPRLVTKTPGIDVAFKPYIAEYKNIINTNEYDSSFAKLSMNFSKLEGNVIGMCWWLIDGDLEIEIDKDRWDWSSFANRQFLVYHELEHCIRNRLHTNRVSDIKNILDFFDELGYYIGILPKKGSLSDGCPASLMNSHTMSWSCQQRHYDYYLLEMMKWRK